MNTALGRLEKVDLRDVWTDEARDFTPWLAQAGNLSALAEAIGIDLELEGTEQNVGPFNADILCKDTLDDQWVLIENQLERTDHTHLGQLLTYAAGLDAVTIVWITCRFREEHRAALDWLNGNTETGIHFFGIEIELWRIGDSPPAPKFNLVSKPNDWSKTVSRSAESGDLTDTQQLKLEYWTSLAAHIEEQATRLQVRSPAPRNYMDFAVGRSGCNLAANINTQVPYVRVLLWISGRPESEAIFHLLREERDQIEDEVGTSLTWLPRPNKKSFVVEYRWDDDPTDRDAWPDQRERMADLLDAFHRTFAPRLKRLDPEDWVPAEGELDADPMPDHDLE